MARGSARVLIPVAFLLGTRGSVVAFVAVLQPVFPIGVRGSQVHPEGFIFTTPRPPGLGCQRVTAASALPGSAWASEFWMAGEERSDGQGSIWASPSPLGSGPWRMRAQGTRATRIILTHSSDGNGLEPHTVGRVFN